MTYDPIKRAIEYLEAAQNDITTARRLVELRALRRRVANQRDELARFNKIKDALEKARRDAWDEKVRAMHAAQGITAVRENNCAAAWRHLALERMAPDETVNDLKLIAMRLTLNPHENPESSAQ